MNINSPFQRETNQLSTERLTYRPTVTVTNDTYTRKKTKSGGVREGMTRRHKWEEDGLTNAVQRHVTSLRQLDPSATRHPRDHNSAELTDRVTELSSGPDWTGPARTWSALSDRMVTAD